MLSRYRKFDPADIGESKRLEELKKLFNYLLLQSNGDVNQALQWMKYLSTRMDLFGKDGDLRQFTEWLREQGLITADQKGEMNEAGDDGDPQYSLTRKGERTIREDALDAIFSNLHKSFNGSHPVPQEGEGIERLSETRGWKFGDPPSNIDFTNTISNAIRRDGLGFTLSEDDLEVYETEHLASASTVLLLDISHSMVLYGEDRITPAKQVALALSELIRRKYPKDFFKVVLFGDDAFEVQVEDLPYASVGPYHTNTKAALQLAQSLLQHQRGGNKQIFMITDGKPSAIYERGRLYINSMGLDPKIVNRTIDEAARCRMQRIPITTFMVTEDPYLVKFVRQLTEVNHGRAYYSSLDKLGEYVFEDFVRNRKRRVR
jgi:Ca-activated chloride channel homolog